MTPIVKGAMVAAAAMALGVSPARGALINIPALHVRHQLSMNLNAGPAWWPDTGRPGSGRTVAIAGHRTTHTRPFTYLNLLRRGDKVYLRYQGKRFAYVVTIRRVISANNLHIADDVGHERLLLTACAKRDGTPTSASYRIVVYALPIKRRQS